MALLNRLKIGLLTGLAALVMGCGGSGSDNNNSSQGCNLVTNYGCSSGRVCVANEEGVGVCIEKDTPSNDVASEKDNYQPNCTSHFQKICSGDDLYWQDSCENFEEMIYTCNYGCFNGECQKWSPEEVMEDVGYDAGFDVLGDLGFEVCGWQCNNGMCLPNSYVCNGVYDCDGGEDESSGAGCSCEWECNNGKCIHSDWVCDGEKDCSSGEDEKNCSCPEYTCNDGMCISYDWVCDGGADCSNGEDEEGCCLDECASEENKCEKQDLYHCLDTNEDGCLEWSLAGNCVKDGSGSNYCMDGNYYCDTMPIGCDDGESLVSFSMICDGKEDCSDGSDENSCYLCQISTKSCKDIIDCTNNVKDMPEHYFNLCICQSDDTSIQKLFELYACAFSNCGGVSGITQSCLDDVMYNECSYALNDCMNDN